MGVGHRWPQCLPISNYLPHFLLLQIPDEDWQKIKDDLVKNLTTRVPCKAPEVCQQVQHLKERVIKSKLPNWG